MYSTVSHYQGCHAKTCYMPGPFTTGRDAEQQVCERCQHRIQVN